MAAIAIPDAVRDQHMFTKHHLREEYEVFARRVRTDEPLVEPATALHRLAAKNDAARTWYGDGPTEAALEQARRPDDCIVREAEIRNAIAGAIRRRVGPSVPIERVAVQ